MKKCLLIFLVSQACMVHAQETWTPQHTDYTFESAVFDTTRTISIYLPEVYFSEPETALPIALLFDGQFAPYLQMTAGTMEYYHQVEEAPAFILVSVHSHDRWFDFTSPNREGISTQYEGGAELLTRHLKEEVLPYLHANFRTTPFCLGIAHSLGGTYVIDEFFSKNSVFNAIIAASPNTVEYDFLPVERMSAFLNTASERYGFGYVGVGDVDDIEKWFELGLNQMDSIIDTLKIKGLQWHSVRVENEGHSSGYLRILDDGLHALQRSLELNEVELVVVKEASDEQLVQAVHELFLEKGKYTMVTDTINYEGLGKVYKALRELHAYDDAIRILNLQKEILQTELGGAEKMKKVETGISYCSFYRWTFPAKKALDEENYKEAARLYDEAMKLEVLRGTHVERYFAAMAFSKTGDVDAAFEQLELLDTNFGWMGRKNMDLEVAFDPLRKDPRWEPLMQRFAQNYFDELGEEE